MRCSVLLLCLIPFVASSHEVDNKIPPEGNFSLEASQQPGPFFSFGQNIIDKNQSQLFVDENFLKLNQAHFTALPILGLYQISKNASLLAVLPFNLDFRVSDHHSSGLGDIDLQGEYAIYRRTTSTHTKQMTVVTGITFPTGSFKKNPPTGFGTSSFFLGATYNETYVNWLWFISPGFVTFKKQSNFEWGDQILYQLGMGKVIKSKPNAYIFSGLLEIDGLYLEKNKISGIVQNNSGGNIIWIGPSLWFSTKNLISQIGVEFPLSQQLNGNQPRIEYLASLLFGWTFT